MGCRSVGLDMDIRVALAQIAKMMMTWLEDEQVSQWKIRLLLQIPDPVGDTSGQLRQISL